MRGFIPKNLVDKILMISLLLLFSPVLAFFLAIGIDEINPTCSYRLILSKACKSISAEAISYINSFNRGQSYYRMENSKFANSLEELQLGIRSETLRYSYSMKVTDNAAFIYAIAMTGNKIIPSSFVGAVFIDKYKNQDALKTINIICEANSRDSVLAEPYLKDGTLVCGKKTHSIN